MSMIFSNSTKEVPATNSVKFLKFRSTKGIKLDSASGLLQRRQGLALKAVSTLTLGKNKSNKTKNPFKLVKDMQKNTSSLAMKCSSWKGKNSDNDYDYIFHRHNAVNKSEKEKSIAQFLDNEAIFQINIKVSLEDYKFKF